VVSFTTSAQSTPPNSFIWEFDDESSAMDEVETYVFDTK